MDCGKRVKGKFYIQYDKNVFNKKLNTKMYKNSRIALMEKNITTCD